MIRLVTKDRLIKDVSEGKSIKNTWSTVIKQLY